MSETEELVKESPDTRVIDPEELYAQSVEKWGFGLQLLLLMEESSELCGATSHFLRTDNLDEMAEEIADVQIVIEQVIHHLEEKGYSSAGLEPGEFLDRVCAWRWQKLARLRERIEGDGKHTLEHGLRNL